MLAMNSLIKTMPCANSYIRSSLAAQAKGDSLRRRMEMAKKYAEENGLISDTSLNLDAILGVMVPTNRLKQFYWKV